MKTKTRTYNQAGKCSLCTGTYVNYGNNPEPLKEFHERCCDKCDMKYVIPARMRLLTKMQDKETARRFSK